MEEDDDFDANDPLNIFDPELDELWNADPNCEHHVVCAPGGGIKCTKCPGWFCY